MKTFYKDKELLSAYIDGELSPREKEYIEGKISSSLQLQKELTEIKRLKELTSSGYERLPESPFFQSRLSAEMNASKPMYAKAKRWIPAISLTVITAALMITLKFYPNLIKDVIEEQKLNLANLYKENLQPLLFAADLTNEDIFNFAFKSELPLDNTDQHFLRLGYDQNGEEYFEIKKSPATIKENNLEKFVQALDLNDDQRKEMDSIISSYTNELLTQVLISDKNAVAINPDLWNYQKAIAAEILAFAKSKNAGVYNNIVTPQTRGNEFLQLANFVRDKKPSNETRYIFFTPDTIFTDTFVFDDKEFRRDMVEMEKEFAEMNKNIIRMNYQIQLDTTFKRLEQDSLWAEEFSVQFDSERFRVNIPNIVMRNLDIQLPNMDSINTNINNALKRMEVYVNKIPDKQINKRKFKVEVHGGDSTGLNRFHFQGNKIDSLLKYELRSLDSLRKNGFDSFNFFDDSTSKGFNYFFNDSLFFNQNEELRKQMNELKEEMRRFRDEMRNFQADPPSQADTVKPRLKGIEI